MKHKKRVWLSEEAYTAAKVNSALQGLKLTAYLDKTLVSDKKVVEKNNQRGYYGFLK